MFDFAWSEIGLIAFVSVMVMGPKQLPETMRTVAKVMRRVKNLGSEFQGHINDMVREAELDEVRQKVQQISRTSLSSEMAKVVDPDGQIEQALSGTTKSAEDTLAETAAMEATEAAEAASAEAARAASETPPVETAQIAAPASPVAGNPATGTNA